MTTNLSSSQPFKELSVEAKTLLFIYASAAWARQHAHIPHPSILLGDIEKVWCSQKLSAEAVSNPDRMTRLLEKHFESTARGPATRNNTCRSRVSQ